MKKFLETSIKYSVENTDSQRKKLDRFISLRQELKDSSQLDMYQYLSLSNSLN